MEREENVYADARTEEIATANAGEEKDLQAPTEASAELGKFKDVNALLKAYGSLQAEFTRRSQRLKELERQAEKSEKSQGGEVAKTGAEKLRQSAALRRDEEKRFDEFVREIERMGDAPSAAEADSAKAVRTEQEAALQAEREALDGERDARALEGERQALSSVANSPKATMPSEELYELASRDESVRLKIVGEYLASLGRSGAPLARGGAGLLTAPTLRAKSIDEAGAMALRFFRKEKN